MNSVIVFALLGVIWAAVLIPPWLQSRREARPNATIRSFHRQLGVLGRTGPGAPEGRRTTRYGAVRFVSDDGLTPVGPVGPAPLDRAEHTGRFSDVDPFLSEPDPGYALADGYDARDPSGRGRGVRRDLDPGPRDLDPDDLDLDPRRLDPGAFDPDPRVFNPDPRVFNPDSRVFDPDLDGEVGPDDLLEPVDYADAYGDYEGELDAEGEVVVYGDDEQGYRPAPDQRARSLAARRRAEGYRRRRQVLTTLLVAAGITLAWALVLRSTVAWALQGVADVLLVTYVALLIRRQRRSAERAVKVRYLAPADEPYPTVVVLPRDAAR